MRDRDRILAFLMFHQNLDFCDACLAAQLGMPAQDVTTTVAQLAKTPTFLRDRWACHGCGQERLVTRALSNRTVSTKGRLQTRILGRVAWPLGGRPTRPIAS